MTFVEKRKHPRVNINNLISYRCMDDSGNQTKEGRGKSINISQGGILIETHDPFEWQDIIRLFIDIEDESVNIKGKVVYCNAANFGKFRTGIQFLETNEKIVSFVIKLLETYSKLLGIA
ncbi:MAG: PilZ domain-containing protein [Desulfobacteraceae bacterium]|nr:PilZ domain-containing protein [Desulfobacteraceae bacterium]MDH3573466.1 PilZ domain-containing protein [Desulfobacteraceae bacterium]MDH3720818.1 PilZ domain-containing protein [Desulfobacteraceae bacterium]MDH3836791.1 PilZ domain-containing protein [Desulfobacteraceae bacterium]MDH3874634.1 PilZ domain-containing protein [Desulfobacteraceae bacterium]